MNDPDGFRIFQELLVYLAPVIIIQLGLALFALVDLARRQQVRGPRWVWAVVLVISIFALPTGIVIAALYLVWGRRVEAVDDPN
jgi:hypothetical protein